MRMRKDMKASASKHIAGVPIYNYEADTHAAGLVELEKEARDWILMLKSDVSEEQLESFCDLSSTTCTPEGHAGVVPFVVMHGSEDDLKKMVEIHSDVVSFVEPEFEMSIIPEVPSEGVSMLEW